MSIPGFVRVGGWIAVATVACQVALAQSGKKPNAPGPDNAAFESALRAELDSLREQFAAGEGDLGQKADRLFDLAIAYCIPAGDAALLRDIEGLRRQLVQLGALKSDEAVATRKILASNPVLARAVAGAIDRTDSVRGAYAVLRALAEKFPDRVLDSGPAGAKDTKRKHADLSNLVAAFCIVYDSSGGGAPREAGTAEEDPKIETARVTALFDYFSSNVPKLAFGPQTPPELLAHVVDVDPRVTMEDLNWAVKSYAGNKAVGKLYKTIVYDTAHFKRGAPKKVEKAPGGVTLQNIKKFGGVCVEQAMFAANVGKAIGVPTVEVIGRGSDVGHAWVGYLKSVGSGKFEWDFDEGRYDEYKDVRGNVRDPRSGATVSDGFIGLLAGLAGTSTGSPQAVAAAAAAREDAAALFDAAERLSMIDGTRLPYPPLEPAGAKSATTVRPFAMESQVELVEMGLRRSPSSRRGWELIARIAGMGRLNPAQLKTWSERIIELCTDDYPDFAFDALAPMIRAVNDQQEQDRLWEWAVGRFTSRKDLAGAAILARGDLWAGKDPARAWEFYHDVIERYPNDGMIIMDALSKGEQLLAKQGKPEAIVDLYQTAWARITKPKSAANEFTRGSSWVLVGRRYAQLLEGSGKPIDAKKIRDAIKEVLEK